MSGRKRGRGGEGGGGAKGGGGAAAEGGGDGDDQNEEKKKKKKKLKKKKTQEILSPGKEWGWRLGWDGFVFFVFFYSVQIPTTAQRE